MKSIDINLQKLILNAAEIVAPLWPMQTIIARNPLHGLESLKFEDALAVSKTFLTDSCEVPDAIADRVNREMIKWCQVFLDEGQGTITMPEREKGFYNAWALLAPFDDHLQSLKKNKWLSSLPQNAEEAISFCLKKLAISDDEIEEFFKYALAELPGWAGYIKWRAEWQNREDGLQNPITLIDFLAVRLVITCAFAEDDKKFEFKKNKSLSKSHEEDFINQLKIKEDRYLKTLLKATIPQGGNQIMEKTTQADVQIVFCIDVRSEPFRKKIESEGNYETFGFAGFFGLPIFLRKYSEDAVKACCPVLLRPRYEVCEEPIEAESKRIKHLQKGQSLLKMCYRFYQDLKYNFATPFALVETLGVWCGLWMALRTLAPISSVKIRQTIQEKVKPPLKTLPRIDIPLCDQIIFGESALRMMGLTKNFSRLILLCGHASKTENNPYASALDCGACGGNHGGPNGKILAAILNSHEVRVALQKKGILIPDDTLFLGAQHNTTTDEVIIYDYALLSSPHKELVEKLKADFLKAGQANSQYRCRTFGFETSQIKAKNHVLKRSCNWAEVRPEWGLARNAAFIVGPRRLTQELDLEGRCFLHSYEWNEDHEGKSLETILSAPMVVAEWINTQYFFSTLNNSAYGSGSKVTHNITCKFGVMQGNSSDLMQGLPLQSVNSTDDESYHEAMRLQVLVYAPRSKIDAVIEKQCIVQTLLFNQWVILVAIDPIDRKPYRLIGKSTWAEIKMEDDLESDKKNSINFRNISKPAYQDKSCAIATLHDKEKVNPHASHQRISRVFCQATCYTLSVLL